MDIKVASYVFTLVFMAELGDKTQLATLACAGCEVSKISVFIGAALALTLAAGLATVLGDVISQYVSANVIRKGAGVMFLAFGVLYLFKQ